MRVDECRGEEASSDERRQSTGGCVFAVVRLGLVLVVGSASWWPVVRAPPAGRSRVAWMARSLGGSGQRRVVPRSSWGRAVAGGRSRSHGHRPGTSEGTGSVASTGTGSSPTASSGNASRQPTTMRFGSSRTRPSGWGLHRFSSKSSCQRNGSPRWVSARPQRVSRRSTVWIFASAGLALTCSTPVGRRHGGCDGSSVVSRERGLNECRPAAKGSAWRPGERS